MVARMVSGALAARDCARPRTVSSIRSRSATAVTSPSDVAEATSLGLVTAVAERDRIDETVRGLAQSLAGNAPLTIRATKEAVRRMRCGGGSTPVRRTTSIAACYGSEDFREGVAAFLAKRRARLTGR